MKNVSGRRFQGHGFTIIEILVVVTIIVLLVAILIPVVSKSRNNARATATRAQMEHLLRACEDYYVVFNAYPGPLDDRLLNGTTKFSGAQNLYVGLSRRWYPSVPGGTLSGAQPDSTIGSNPALAPAQFWVDTSGANTLLNYSSMVGGALTNIPGVPVPANAHDPFYVPDPSEVSSATHSTQSNGLDLTNFPAFVDRAFGTDSRPILYYRQVYKYDKENAALGAAAVSNTPYAFTITANNYTVGLPQSQACFYANSNTLIDKDGQIPTAVAAGGVPALDAYVTKQVNGNNVPVGQFVLISAGVDRVYGTSDDIVVEGGK